MKRFLPHTFLLLAMALVAYAIFRPEKKPQGFEIEAFGKIPVLVNGRIKPLDTVARTSLLFIRSKQSYYHPSTGSIPAIHWLLDVLYSPDRADAYQHFRVDNHEVLDLFGLTVEDGYDKKYFSFLQLRPKLAELETQAKNIEPVAALQRTPFQRELMKLRERIALYVRLQHSLQNPASKNFHGDLVNFADTIGNGVAAMRAKENNEPFAQADIDALVTAANVFQALAKTAYFRPIPFSGEEKNSDENWATVGDVLFSDMRSREVNPLVMTYAAIGNAWNTGDAKSFNEGTALYTAVVKKHLGERAQKSVAEHRFNRTEPFYQAMVLYVVAFLLAILSWMFLPRELGKAAANVALVAWLLTTAGILTRMWLEGRPPVTNLYSSALFVGWGASALGLILERIYRNSLGTVVAAPLGFLTLIIAHHLSLNGDTLEMMRAVLDSNFWLATHVVVITLGYSATFLAGFLGLLHVLLSLTTRRLARPVAEGKTETMSEALARMAYGIVCFATLFSLVGTILGGIWADQSWGRFWGWDPKENGALIIVLWNAIFLHARWGGIVRQRGLMNLAIFGNIVTAWSWFGTNMLGVGLHSYGFMDAAFIWLVAFIASQLLLIALSFLPRAALATRSEKRA